MTTLQTVDINPVDASKKLARKIIRRQEIMELKDSYIKDLIRQSSFYLGGEITEKMINEKREKVITDRIIKKRKEEAKLCKNDPYIFYVDKEFRQ